MYNDPIISPMIQFVKSSYDNGPSNLPYQYGGYLLSSDGEGKSQTAVIGINASATLAVPYFLNEYHKSLYKFISGSADADITISSYPLPPTIYNKIPHGKIESFTAALFTMIAINFIPASIIAYIVKEKDSVQNAKHLQLVSGASLSAYWISNYLWDITIYMVTLISLGLIIVIFQVPAYIGCSNEFCITNAPLSTFLLFLFFGTSVIPFTYIFSFFFKQPTLAQSFALFKSFFFGLCLMIATFIMDRIDVTMDFSAKVKYFLWFFPHFSLGNGFLTLAIKDYSDATPARPPNITTRSYDALAADVTLTPLLYMGIMSIPYLLITIYIDYLTLQGEGFFINLSNNCCDKKNIKNNNSATVHNDNNNIIEEF